MSNTQELDNPLHVPSLSQMLDPEVLADPYPLYRELREHAPVLWDPLLHSWVVTGYDEVLKVLHDFSARCAPSPRDLEQMGLGALAPVAELLVRQMLFLDPPDHTRLRALASAAFTTSRVDAMRRRIQEITDGLLDTVIPRKRMEVLAEFAEPLPSIVTAGVLGVPIGDYRQLKAWSVDFAQILSNLQLDPDNAGALMRSVNEMAAYFEQAVRRPKSESRPGLVEWLTNAEVDGDRLSEKEVVANIIITMVGAQETTTNLIGCGLLTLLRNPDQLAKLRDNPALVKSGVEELLRYESPSQKTSRKAPEDVELGGKLIRKGDNVITIMAAANRDPRRFPDPDRVDIERPDNRHLAFGWARHFCFGAPLARMEGEIAFSTLLRRLPGLRLEPGPIEWREQMGLRGLKALHVAFN